MNALRHSLLAALGRIDRPDSFCSSGSVPAILPGLEVQGVGPVGLPLSPAQAKGLASQAEQAPYGKGERTLVDTSVRNVWRLTPDRFSLNNPAWPALLAEVVGRVQQGLGLEKQELTAHVYDLLLYEPGGFFLPHKDGEKLDRMVATLVVVLPAAHEGGELVVRHEGREQVIDFAAGGPFSLHYAAFYADCEHEIRPVTAGHRLCLVYNLTLAKAKGTGGVSAPRAGEHVEAVREVLAAWPGDGPPDKLAVTLGHQYTKGGLTWDALKGADRGRARALVEAARLSGCHAHLALVTLHQSGEGDDGSGDYYGRGRRRRKEGGSQYEMLGVSEESLTAEDFLDADGEPSDFGVMLLEEDEILDPAALRGVEPEEEFEGYTGNAGMTLDRWYRHAAVVLWPDSRHFEISCGVGTDRPTDSLRRMVSLWKMAAPKDADALKVRCLAFARTTLAEWRPSQYHRGDAPPCELLQSLAQLDDVDLLRAYLRDVLAKDASVEPAALLAVCQRHGWATFSKELEGVFAAARRETIERDVALLERLCTAKPKKKQGWSEVCQASAASLVAAVERLGGETRPAGHWHREATHHKRLAALARALLAAGQFDLLDRLVTHVLGKPQTYGLTDTLLPLLGELRPWVAENVKASCAPLRRLAAECRAQYEALTSAEPPPPADLRRASVVGCTCAYCKDLKTFLESPTQRQHSVQKNVSMRNHVEEVIRKQKLDLDCRTDRNVKPQALVCTKNTASHQAALRKYHEDLERLATVKAVEAELP